MSEVTVQVVPKSGMGGDLAGRTLTENLMKRLDELGESISKVAGGIQERMIEADKRDGPWGLSEVGALFRTWLSPGSVDLQSGDGA
ncbi:hypothetical protein [Phytohabitans aurantiacus]|uniref:hypothetical protein n=1 Tax=Phytohabitans aurantiacus TaxID=3016789 RepID=UPI00249291F0|nr:hypothetical protein [Phytohabitans aurantiacus]